MLALTPRYSSAWPNARSQDSTTMPASSSQKWRRETSRASARMASAPGRRAATALAAARITKACGQAPLSVSTGPSDPTDAYQPPCSTSRNRPASAARLPEGGFGWLDDEGNVVPGHPCELWITCRMTYAYALGSMLGRPGAGVLADHGLAALTGRFRDVEHGGWYASVGSDGPVDTDKGAYPH